MAGEALGKLDESDLVVVGPGTAVVRSLVVVVVGLRGEVDIGGGSSGGGAAQGHHVAVAGYRLGGQGEAVVVACVITKGGGGGRGEVADVGRAVGFVWQPDLLVKPEIT